MAGPLRPYPPPLFELNGRWNVGKKGFKKVIFSLIARPFIRPPPPLLMARPLREELFFGFPKHYTVLLLLYYLAVVVVVRLCNVVGEDRD